MILAATARARQLAVAAGLTRGRDRLGQVVLWLGLLFPLVVDQVRTREQVLAGELSPVELLRGLVPLTCLALGVALARPQLRPITRTEAAFGLFIAVAVASTTWSVVHWATLLKAGSLLAAYVTVLAIARLDERQHQRSLDGLAVVIYTIVALALVQLVVDPRAVMVRVDGPQGSLRLQGILPAVPADLLGFLAGVGTLFLLQRVGPGWRGDGWARALLVVACLLVLALTRARVAVVLLGLGLAILYRHRLVDLARSRVSLPLAAAAILTIGVLLVAGGPWLGGLATRGQDLQQILTLTGRTVTWSDALAQWAHRPLVGYGYYAGHRFAIPVRPGWTNLQNLDSMWVETLVDLGVVGLAAILAAVGSAAFDLLRPRVVDPQLAVRRTVFVLGLLASFVNPSLQAYTYTMVVMAVVSLGAPRLRP